MDHAGCILRKKQQIMLSMEAARQMPSNSHTDSEDSVAWHFSFRPSCFVVFEDE